MSSTIHDRTKIMENMARQIVDGVPYILTPYCQDIPKRFKDIRDLEIRDDDVLCVGFPRVGNHWAYEVGRMILQQEATFVEDTFLSSLLEFVPEPFNDRLEKMSSPRYLTTHLRMDRVPVQAIEKNIPIIYLMRNPKDALVSHYKFFAAVQDHDMKFLGNWDDYFEAHMAGEFIYGSWFDHVLAAEEFMKQNPNQRVYIHSFEKMKKDPEGAVKDLCKFLGRPNDTLVKEIAIATEFANMKIALQKGGKMKAEEKFLQDGGDIVIRKGKSGGWKEVFSVSQSERFDRVFHEKLAGSNLAEYVKEYL